MILRNLEGLQLARVMELEWRCILCALMHDDKLVQIGVFSTTMNSHWEFTDARVWILHTDEIKRLSSIYTLKERRLEPTFESHLDRTETGSVGLTHAELFKNWELLEVKLLQISKRRPLKRTLIQTNLLTECESLEGVELSTRHQALRFH